jgi:uncharacterized protein YceK
VGPLRVSVLALFAALLLAGCGSVTVTAAGTDAR